MQLTTILFDMMCDAERDDDELGSYGGARAVMGGCKRGPFYTS